MTDDDGTTKIGDFLRGEFLPGSYVFNLWIDGDDVIYNNTNRAAGLSVVYADGTSFNLLITGGENVGF